MLQGMFGKRLAEHFSLLEPSSLVLDPKGNSQVALTRMRMPNGFPGPLHTFHQKRLFRYPCTCAVPTALRAGERGLTDAFIVSPNGGVPGSICASGVETNWNKRSGRWREARSIVRNR